MLRLLSKNTTSSNRSMTPEQKKKNTAKNKIRRIKRELEKNPNNTYAKRDLEKWSNL